jgi:hypothetical protein
MFRVSCGALPQPDKRIIHQTRISETCFPSGFPRGPRRACTLRSSRSGLMFASASIFSDRRVSSRCASSGPPNGREVSAPLVRPSKATSLGLYWQQHRDWPSLVQPTGFEHRSTAGGRPLPPRGSSARGTQTWPRGLLNGWDYCPFRLAAV